MTRKDSETFGDIEITRIGQGSFKNVTASTSGHSSKPTKITYPVFSETVYYFINGRLFKAKKLNNGIDYNFDPASYWVDIYTVECYFKNDKQVECKNYIKSGISILSAETKEVSRDYKLFKNIDIVKEAYELLNSEQ